MPIPRSTHSTLLSFKSSTLGSPACTMPAMSSAITKIPNWPGRDCLLLMADDGMSGIAGKPVSIVEYCKGVPALF